MSVNQTLFKLIFMHK